VKKEVDHEEEEGDECWRDEQVDRERRCGRKSRGGEVVG
jgi:hypothetical protein